MKKIIKFEETMTSRERVLRTFHFEKSDRVPIDYSSNPTIHAKLCKELGVAVSRYDLLIEALGVDFMPVGAPYKGPLLFKEIEGKNVDPVYGFYTKWVPNSSGGYMDFCDYPLLNADDEVIANFPVPVIDDFDFSNIKDTLNYYKDYALYVGNAGTADIINSTGRVMGMEDTLVNLMTENEAVLKYINKRCDMELGVMERILEMSKGRIDFLWMGEDLGTQNAPMISLEMYRKVLRPLHQRYIDLAKSYNLPVMIHTCGSSSWAYNDFIEMGINAVDTLQPEAANMSPDFLAKNFGGELAFHGCISTAGSLAYGNELDVVNSVTETLEKMKPVGGYMLAPTHQIQDNTPVENIIAMYQTAHIAGSY